MGCVPRIPLALKDVARYSGLSLAQVKKLQASMALEGRGHRRHVQLTAAAAILGNVELHGLGSSINCLGRRVTSYTTRDAKEIAKLLAMLS